MLTTDDYLEAASVAAPLFGLAASSISLLSHSENVVCQLTMSDGTRAALRIHRPGYNSLAELRSEVHWVTSLGDFGVPVPTALSTDTVHTSIYNRQIECASEPHTDANRP